LGQHQHQDVGDFVADEIDQQQVAQRLLGGTSLGVGRDLDDVRLRTLAAGAPGEDQAVGELGGQDKVGRGRLPAVQVGNAADAQDGAAMVGNEPLRALVLVFLMVRFGHGPRRSRIEHGSSRGAKSA
jgi:hypothetical protein